MYVAQGLLREGGGQQSRGWLPMTTTTRTGGQPQQEASSRLLTETSQHWEWRRPHFFESKGAAGAHHGG